MMPRLPGFLEVPLIFTGTPKGVGKVSENDILEAYLEDRKILDLRIQ